MLSENFASASHAGEDQSSPNVFAPRAAHWANTLVGLLGAARAVAENYLQEERTDARACIDADHYKAVCGLFDAIELAGALGLTINGALQLADGSAVPLELWFAKRDRFASASIPDLIMANDWLRPGDVIYQSQTILRRTLTDEDFAQVRPAMMGGAQ